MKKVLVLALILSLYAPLSLMAQSIDPYLNTLNQYNRIKPLQNPLWKRSSKVLKGKITDNSNRVIGKIEDILVSPEGAIESIKGDLNRLRISSDVPLNVVELNMSPNSNGYSTSFDNSQVADLIPQILAGVATASGDEDSVFSVDRLVGSDVKSRDGRRLGKIQEVMFSDTGSSVEALIIRVRYGTVGGESVAIPFPDATYKKNGKRVEALIPDNRADSIIAFAKDKN